MNKFTYRLATGITTGAILASALAPAAFAATNVSVSTNGANSKNKATVNNKQKTKVQQSNATAVVNLVGVIQNTGGNKANGNTGGDVTVGSGNANATVSNKNQVGGNTAHVDPCACEAGDTDIDISENGAHSKNTVKVNNTNKTVVQQSNETFVLNGVLVVNNTGGNKANNNTGGTVDVSSGDATADVMNDTATGSNHLNP